MEDKIWIKYTRDAEYNARWSGKFTNLVDALALALDDAFARLVVYFQVILL